MGRMKEEFIKLEEQARDQIAWWVIEEQIEKMKRLAEKAEDIEKRLKEYISKEAQG